MPSKSSLFHVVGRLVAVDRNLGGGWLPRGRPHRTEHLELTAPLGGLTADRPPRTIRRSPPIMSLPVLSPSVGALSLKVSVFLQRKSPPLSDRATWFSETTERAMMHAASLTSQQGRGKGGTNKFQAGSLLRPNPSRTSRTSLSPVNRRRRLLQWCCVLQTRSPPDSSSLAPLPFLFLGRASQPAPSCGGPPRWAEMDKFFISDLTTSSNPVVWNPSHLPIGRAQNRWQTSIKIHRPIPCVSAENTPGERPDAAFVVGDDVSKAQTEVGA